MRGGGPGLGRGPERAGVVPGEGEQRRPRRRGVSSGRLAADSPFIYRFVPCLPAATARASNSYRQPNSHTPTAPTHAACPPTQRLPAARPPTYYSHGGRSDSRMLLWLQATLTALAVGLAAGLLEASDYGANIKNGQELLRQQAFSGVLS
ncbi:Protein of unknown function [Gryllus bimaculatus]|nr:Protein of unknown function [Gryllus bimaculatus]